MGYLSFQIILFLFIAAFLGWLIGWLLRGARFQKDLQDLDARWRTKLGEVESERDRFVTDLTQANEAKAKAESAVLEAKTLMEKHEASLKQLQQDHQARATALVDKEKLAGTLQTSLSASRGRPHRAKR